MAKGFVFAAAAGLALAVSGLPAQAMPVGPVDLGGSVLVTRAAQGCGPGWYRGPYGGCRPMRGGPRYFDPRPRMVAPGMMVAPRFAPRPARCWVERTPYGPRKVCR